MKKWKIAVLIDAWFPFQGGAQIQIEELIKRLKNRCEFTVFHARSSSLAARCLWSVKVIGQVISANRLENFDLLHAHAYVAGFPGKILSDLLKIPVVYTVHGAHTLDRQLLQKQGVKIKVPLFKLALEKTLLTAIPYTRQITVSRNFLTYPNVNKNIAVVSNGVDVAEFDKVKAEKNRQFTIIYVGREDPVKGREFFDQALEILAAKNVKPRVILATGQVTERDELVRLYKSAHLFVSSSLAEGQPLTLLEAWAAKLPVVVTAVGANPQMVKDGVNGYLVPPADAQALAAVIGKAMRQKNLAALGEAGYNLVRKDYTWEKAALKTLKVYKEAFK